MGDKAVVEHIAESSGKRLWAYETGILIEIRRFGISA
jgi:hypothetical protein